MEVIVEVRHVLEEFGDLPRNFFLDNQSENIPSASLPRNEPR